MLLVMGEEALNAVPSETGSLAADYLLEQMVRWAILDRHSLKLIKHLERKLNICVFL